KRGGPFGRADVFPLLVLLVRELVFPPLAAVPPACDFRRTSREIEVFDGHETATRTGRTPPVTNHARDVLGDFSPRPPYPVDQARIQVSDLLPEPSLSQQSGHTASTRKSNRIHRASATGENASPPAGAIVRHAVAVTANRPNSPLAGAW